MLRRQLSFSTLTLLATSATTARAASDAGPAQDALALSREVTLLRTELRQQQDLVLMLRHRLADAETLNAWMPWLVLLLVIAVAAAAWLGMRGRRSRRRHGRSALPAHPVRRTPDTADPDDASGPATVFAPGLAGLMQQESSTALTQISTLAPRGETASEPGSMVLGGAGSMSLGPAAAGLGSAAPGASAMPRPARAEPVKSLSELAKAAAESANERTQAAPPAAAVPESAQPAPVAPAASPQQRSEPALRPGEVTMAVPGPGVGQGPRPVSVEELFDLEQQVDFFLVLGQVESAVDLLVSHIRGTGGNSALPYLKLMEVYRHQGDAESYERTRKRFNQRFNAHAPDWSADPQQGRGLEQYPEVMERLQKTWSMPLDALADLESLLFRRSRGELFDLPAFREVLLLHAMAVDLHDRSPLSASKVDILLPLGEEPSNPPPPVPPVMLPPTTLAKPALAEAPRNRLAEWAGFGNGPREPKPMSLPSSKGEPKDEAFTLDLDLSDFAPAPREYTHPAAFTDLAMRADFSPVPLAAANDQPRGKPPSSSTR